LVVVEALTGRVLDRGGYHTLLHLGPTKCVAYWERRRVAPPDEPETDHAALHRAAHPATASLLARLQPAATTQPNEL
jgi:hypothetical protein